MNLRSRWPASARSQWLPRTLGPVHVPSIVARHRSLRWLVPVGVLGLAGAAATGMFRADATSGSLPATTPAALIAAVQAPTGSGFSGTVVSQLSLGLPELPAIGEAGEGASMSSLLSGSHTLQVWYGGADRQRIALFGAADETDLFRSGRQLWRWSSADHVAVHTVLPTLPERIPHLPLAAPGSTLSFTPSALAASALAALDPSTEVEIEDEHEVADRSAYELVLTPRTAATLVGSVHIAVDGVTKTPLGVQVYARGASTAAVDVAFTSIRFAQPPEKYFHFSPPSDAIVHDLTVDGAQGRAFDAHVPAAAPSSPVPVGAHPISVTGSGWTAVVGYPDGSALNINNGSPALTPVSGSWGKGRLLESALLSVLVTDGGRVYAGAVDPATLFAVAGAG